MTHTQAERQRDRETEGEIKLLCTVYCTYSARGYVLWILRDLLQAFRARREAQGHVWGEIALFVAKAFFTQVASSAFYALMFFPACKQASKQASAHYRSALLS